MTRTAHTWLRSRREALRLRQSDMEQRTDRLNGRVPVTLLSKLENGHVPLRALRAEQVSALCQVLGITATEWTAHATPARARTKDPT